MYFFFVNLFIFEISITNIMNFIFDIVGKNLKTLSDIKIPFNTKILNCYMNNIDNLDNLPQSLTELYCGNNDISSLDNLPQLLKELHCYSNKIVQLDNLHQSLKYLLYDKKSVKITYKFENQH